MSEFWSDLVGRLQPYVPGEQPQGDKLIKLNTNENPYPPAPGVLPAIAAVSGERLSRYPEPDSRRLCAAFAERVGLSAEQVFVGNGSDEVLAHAFQALLAHDQPLLFPDISYSFYPVWCELYGIDYQQIPLTDDFRVDPSSYPANNGGIIVPNPNAPTGILLGLDGVRSLLEANPGSVVVIDEAYTDFGGESATSLVNDYPNLLVIQTLSKSRSLAGLRVGVAFGQRHLIEGLERVKNSFNSYPLDVLAQEAALASLADEDYFRACAEQIINSREALAAGLEDLGFEVLPSRANFVFARHASEEAAQIFSELRSRGIIVRYFSKPRIDGFLRISIGTEEECSAVLAALKEIL